MPLILFASFLAPTVQLYAQQTAYEERLTQELSALQTEVLRKISHDVEDTARAFTTAEDMTRSLRVVYGFKAALDIIASTLSIVGSVTDVTEMFKARNLAKLQSAAAATSFVLAIDTAQQVGKDLHFAFAARPYTDSVERMIRTARSNQPGTGWAVLEPFGVNTFDDGLYRTNIENWITGAEGDGLVKVARKSPSGACTGPSSSGGRKRLVTGVQNVKLEAIQLFKELRKSLPIRARSESQRAALFEHLRRLKTEVIRSKGGTTPLNYRAMRPDRTGRCTPEDISLHLGQVAANQEILRWAYGAYDRDLKLERNEVWTTTRGAVLNTMTLTPAGRGNPILKTLSIAETGFELGQTIHKQSSTSSAREQIVEIPQVMLLTLPLEMSNLMIALDDLKALDLVPENPTDQSPLPIKVATVPTLFLFDVSGSMSDNDKIGQARTAGLDALKEMREAGSPPTSIMTFSGDQCGGNVTKKLLGYTTDIMAAERIMRTGLPPPNGGTPIPQARDAAISDLSVYLNINPNLKEGRVILLSDGQSTCGAIRPPGVFSRRTNISVKKDPFSRIRFFTIGFDVPAGSAAERDLQFLASETGGKYYNAADRDQLIRTLRKQVRRYIPRQCNSGNADFANGVRAFAAYDYTAATDAFRRYTSANQNDWCGFYNLGLAYEASDHYKKAAENYQKYLATAPTSPDRTKIEAKIAEMNEEYVVQFDYYTRLITSDLGYLNAFYKTVFNRSSGDLAAEFDGFVYEKRAFYANLSDTLEIDQRWLSNDSKDISSSLEILAKRRNLESFDRDAVSLLTTPIGQIEDMLDRLRDYLIKNMR